MSLPGHPCEHFHILWKALSRRKDILPTLDQSRRVLLPPPPSTSPDEKAVESVCLSPGSGSNVSLTWLICANSRLINSSIHSTNVYWAALYLALGAYKNGEDLVPSSVKLSLLSYTSIQNKKKPAICLPISLNWPCLWCDHHFQKVEWPCHLWLVFGD